MSRPVGSAVSASSTTTSRSPHVIVVPAERAEAKNRISATGKSRSSEDPPHHGADLAGGADDRRRSQRRAHRPVPP